ncbi:MAG: SLBB domain-containing protein [Ignavibacteriales bacterium]|jgi:protein involved in polysaccharide export with SLBB domain|nr:SLBB domain-containing protein [Ignavibacteriales bacterium]MBK8660984.1 SLBB domain-containing protein [Ignavibacteriales bacterium]MBP9123976.1 SLBB domain-containing protein [Ignavibacteriaceae bacterium]MCC6636679.1 SLBB domain-containing protein [Ignavibacteriaceae bacterium]
MKSFFLSLVLFSLVVSAQTTKEKIPMGISENKLSISVVGNPVLSGSYPAAPGERVDQFLTRIIYNGTPYKITVCLRNIKIKKPAGSEVTIDLQKFRINGDIRENPYLANDDIIVLPTANYEEIYYEIEGAINSSGRYHFLEGDNLQDAIFYAMGISNAFDGFDSTTIYRISYDKTKMEKIRVATTSNFKLKNRDRIVVGDEQPFMDDYKILVIGEVNRPGYIPFGRKNQTLKDAIELAGGFTGNASLNNIRILKSKNLPSSVIRSYYGVDAPKERRDLQEDKDVVDIQKFMAELSGLDFLNLYRLSGLDERDTSYLRLEAQLNFYNNSQLIDLNAKNDTLRNFYENYRVQMGDIVVVSSIPVGINMVGQVPYPGWIAYTPGMDVNYYIRQAGGLNDYANPDDIMVIKGNTKQWHAADGFKGQLEPGDYIYIPKEAQRSFWSYLGDTALVLGIVGNIATLAILFINVMK